MGNAVADVLFGDAEPSGRLSQTFPMRWSDNPTESDDAEVYPGTNGNVRYAEGVFIGYRHYDAKGITPMFPFGHGLGYTSFDISTIEASETSGGITVDVTLKNTGTRKGSTVVQLFVSDTEASVIRPEKELKGFQKISLAAGEEATVSIDLNPRDFAFFDVNAGVWRVEA